MRPEDWERFAADGGGLEVIVGQAPLRVTKHLKANHPDVWMHHDYVLKALQRHELPVTAFSHLPETLSSPISLADKPRHVTFFHHTPVGWLHVTIKVALNSERLYVCTFYKSNAREVGRRMRKFPNV